MVAMPDPDSSPPLQAEKCPNDYPIGTRPATPSLRSLLRGRIARDGPLAFPEFMAAALYEPGLGYYARDIHQVGRGGDFFTSVSVGPVFGANLARRFLREWRESGKPERWRIIECGAHGGTLAADVLAAMAELDGTAFDALEYAIPEPLENLRTAQRETLRHFGEKVRIVADAALLTDSPLPGIAYGNELLDALPFHIVERRGNRWLECRVALAADGGFAWHLTEITDPALKTALTPLGEMFPEGYRTELRTCVRAFLEPLVRALDGGLMIWADYGFARPEYYDPNRTCGTMRTFSKHRAGENPLEAPGEADITAHVDFTAIAETALTLGGQAVAFQNQGAWLTENARDWLLSQEGAPNAAAIRQFRTLTHPAHLGGGFHFLEITWKNPPPSLDSDTLRHRLFG
jgi:SAM-dependent MidA family methyltransferase